MSYYIIEYWIMHIMSQLVFIKYCQPRGSVQYTHTHKYAALIIQKDT